LSRPPIIIAVTGIQAAGKSTVARLLAGRFARGVHIEADVLHWMIVAGAEWVSEPGEPRGEAAAQLWLRLHNACLLARSFYEAGFSVVIDDIILGERWEQLQSELDGLPLELVVLAPSPDVVARERDPRRGKKTVLGPEWATYLDEALRRTMPGTGLWVDSTRQTAEETVAEIVSRLGLGV
jgi:predicted kinase